MMLRIKTPPEKIVKVDELLLIFNAERMLRDRKRVVELACGHLAYTGAVRQFICPRCTEMLRRSIEDGSEDYESYRKGLVRDLMVWPGDPCQRFNEAHLSQGIG